MASDEPRTMLGPLDKRTAEENIAALHRAIKHGEEHLDRKRDELRWYEEGLDLFAAGEPIGADDTGLGR